MHAPDLGVLQKKYRHNKRWVFIEHDMLVSEAFLSLTHTAKVVLLLFLQKRKKPDDHNDGLQKRKRPRKKKAPAFDPTGLIFTSSEAAIYGIVRRTFQRTIDELMAHGFIVITKFGGQFQGERKPNEYTLVDTWREYKGPDSKLIKHPPAPRFSRGFDTINAARKKKNSIDIHAARACDVHAARRDKRGKNGATCTPHEKSVPNSPRTGTIKEIEDHSL